MKLGLALLLWSQIAAAAPDVCATVKSLAKPDEEPRDGRITFETGEDETPTAVKFCPSKSTCKTFALGGLRGSPVEPAAGYLNKEGSLAAVRWIANDERGWHNSLRLFNVKTGKQVKELTRWRHGGWVELTTNRFLVDQTLFDSDGKALGAFDAKLQSEMVSPDGGVVAFANPTTGEVTLYDLATGKQRGSVKTGVLDKQADTSTIDHRFTTDSKTLYVVAGAKVAVIDVATMKATSTQTCPP